MTSNFTIIKQLGTGSFGTVKLATRKADGKKYALKEINVAKMDQNDKADQLNEIRILASIFHPNVLAYYEAFIEEGKLYIVTEFADQGDLDSEIQTRLKQNKSFAEDEVWSIFLQSMSGMRELHNQGILHRDIKGQNILKFANDDNPKKSIYKLADFGVSKVLNNAEDFTKTGIGTPFYICPEIWKNQKYNEKADIFSMGILLYELMSLKHPYNGRDMKELNRNVVKGVYAPLPSKYSQQLRQLCYDMMNNNPDKRPTVKEIFIQPFVEDHYQDCPISVEEVHVGQETALEANVNWEDPELLGTIQMNPKLLAAMQGRANANPYQIRGAYNPYGRNPYGYQQPQKVSADDVKKSLPAPEYEKREQYEKLLEVHQERKDRESQRVTQSAACEEDIEENYDSLTLINPIPQQQQYVPNQPSKAKVPSAPVYQIPQRPANEQYQKPPVVEQRAAYPMPPTKPQIVKVNVVPSPQMYVPKEMMQPNAVISKYAQPSPPIYKPSSAQAQRQPPQQVVKPPSIPQKPVQSNVLIPKQSIAKQEAQRQNQGSKFW